MKLLGLCIAFCLLLCDFSPLFSQAAPPAKLNDEQKKQLLAAVCFIQLGASNNVHHVIDEADKKPKNKAVTKAEFEAFAHLSTYYSEILHKTHEAIFNQIDANKDGIISETDAKVLPICIQASEERMYVLPSYLTEEFKLKQHKVAVSKLINDKDAFNAEVTKLKQYLLFWYDAMKTKKITDSMVHDAVGRACDVIQKGNTIGCLMFKLSTPVEEKVIHEWVKLLKS